MGEYLTLQKIKYVTLTKLKVVFISMGYFEYTNHYKKLIHVKKSLKVQNKYINSSTFSSQLEDLS
jgi:hypothetical protein